MSTMIVTDTDRTFLWLGRSFQGERQLVDITNDFQLISTDCPDWAAVVNKLRAEGHVVVDSLPV